ncbi:uncharacterized protein LOC128555876 [Mercenaria mercenaria]|uniref:uncharacterized protein LOC128555876 n=1 Tax=Mercenaria mercenaria TaxID=6596 RepID=UPI00234ECC2C|nr:uncharacterized protein LOC128555876 [Mercenaria mercenaria]
MPHSDWSKQFSLEGVCGYALLVSFCIRTMNSAVADLLSSLMTESRRQAMETFVLYKRRGIVRRAQNLIENIDNVVTCINLDHGRYPALFKSSMSALSKLNLWENEIREAANETDMSDVIAAARFLLENQGLLTNELDNMDKAKKQITLTDTIVISDEDNDELPDIISPTMNTKSKSPIHKLKPYTRPSSTVTSSTLTETAWEKRENELLLAHQRELSEAKQEARDELMLCIICLSAQKDHTLVPCGHTFCEYCVGQIKAKGKCCFCNAKIRSSVKVRLTD